MDEDISQLIDNINAVIKTNGNEEITGEILNSILNQIVSVFYGITGDKQYLNTETKDNLVDAINELQDLLGQINTIKLLSGTANPNTVPPNGGDYEVRDFYMQTSNLGTIALWIYTGVIGVEWLNLTAKESDIVFVSNLPTNGNSTKLYIRTSDNTIWRWQLGGSLEYPVSTFVQIGGGSNTLQEVLDNSRVSTGVDNVIGTVNEGNIVLQSNSEENGYIVVQMIADPLPGNEAGLGFMHQGVGVNGNEEAGIVASKSRKLFLSGTNVGFVGNQNSDDEESTTNEMALYGVQTLEIGVKGIDHSSALLGERYVGKLKWSNPLNKVYFEDLRELGERSGIEYGADTYVEDDLSDLSLVPKEFVNKQSIKTPFRFIYNGSNATQTLPEPINEVIDLMIEGVGDYDDQIEFTPGETEITITADMLPNMRVKLIYR